MVPSKDLRRESNSCRAGTRKHGEVRSTYSTLGMARALRKDRRHHEHVKAVACSPGSEVPLFSSVWCLECAMEGTSEAPWAQSSVTEQGTMALQVVQAVVVDSMKTALSSLSQNLLDAVNRQIAA